ncbi:cytoplasmic membrane protein [Vairimorpha apis BRL 01]|uniref:Cytoplasmic membrane protein n=1 Tax=Vairimorpha apis BRL 01 TaxID=1037528 RepID=T0KZ08_9MICR|nr:cytoplasmic membrane protein [Vairimorpha apis BRL 01]
MIIWFICKIWTAQEEINILKEKKLSKNINMSFKKLEINDVELCYFQNFQVLILSNNNLICIPEKIRKFTNLKILLLQNNLIQSLPASIIYLNKLVVLNYSSNSLFYIPKYVGKLKSLEELYLENNNLIDNLSILRDLKKLIVLNVSNNKLKKLFEDIDNCLTTLPDNIGNLSNLEILYVNNNYLESLPTTIYKLQNLIILDIKNNNLILLPDNICFLKNLTYLYANKNKLLRLPVIFGSLINLKYLDLSDNLLKNIPYSFGNLINLVNITLKNNYLEKIPKEFNYLCNLKLLNLSFNCIFNFPQLNNLKNLEIINLSNNKIRFLPIFHEFSKLKILNLSNNEIKVISSDIKNLKNLKILNMEHNQIYTISSNVGFLKKLEILNLSYNKLVSLPEEIVNLSNLIKLQCNNNYLENLSNNIFKLIRLENLELHNNNICSFSKGIYKLQNLKSLNLKNNKILKIPEKIEQLSNLMYLNISSNNIIKIPNSIGTSHNFLKNLPFFIKDVKSLCSEYFLKSNKYIENQFLLPNLTFLDLSYNCLVDIPICIMFFKNLKYLNCSFNKIEVISKKIKNLQNLKILNLYHNNIHSLPKEILNLALNLNELNIACNDINPISSYSKVGIDEVLNIIKVNLPCQILYNDKEFIHKYKTENDNNFDEEHVLKRKNIYYFTIDKTCLIMNNYNKDKPYIFEYKDFKWDINTLDYSKIIYMSSMLDTFINLIKDKCTIYICAFNFTIKNKDLYMKKYSIENQLYNLLDHKQFVKFIDYNYLNRVIDYNNSHDSICIKKNEYAYVFPIFYNDLKLETLFNISTVKNNIMTDFLPITVFHDVNSKFMNTLLNKTEKISKNSLNIYKKYIYDLKKELNFLNSESVDDINIKKERSKNLAKFFKIFEYFYNINNSLLLEKISIMLNDEKLSSDLFFQFNYKMIEIYIAIKTRIQRFFFNFEHIPTLQVNENILDSYNYFFKVYFTYVKNFEKENNIIENMRSISRSDWLKLKRLNRKIIKN